MTQIGLLFGSFNPVHNGHVAMAQAALAQTPCQEVWLIVQSHNKYKQQPDLLPIGHRLTISGLAVPSTAKMKVFAGASDLLITLGSLHREHPTLDFALVMGDDLVTGLPQWQDGAELLQNYHIYCYPRPTVAATNPFRHSHIHALQGEAIDISSAQIRQHLAAGRSITALVPPPVAAYIQNRQLYA